MATPTGTMKAAQTTISQIVPMSGDSMPALSGNADGKLVMKSQLRACRSRPPRRRRAAAPSIPMPATVQNTMSPRKTRSLTFSRGEAGGMTAAVRAHSYTCLYLRTNRIAIAFISERHEEERRPDREDRLVADRPRRHVALRRAGDERGHRRVRLFRRRSTCSGSARRRRARSSSRRSRARRRARSRRRCPTAPPGRRSAARPGASTRPARMRPRAATCGTDVIASSASDAMVGRTMKPMMIPAESELKTCTSNPSRSFRIVGREVGEREVAEDDRRDAGEHLEDRLDGLADASGARTPTR